MTQLQRILALDAACCAAECTSVSANLRDAISLLQDELDVYFETLSEVPFEDFLAQQLAAVKLLASSPETFGAE